MLAFSVDDFCGISAAMRLLASYWRYKNSFFDDILIEFTIFALIKLTITNWRCFAFGTL